MKILLIHNQYGKYSGEEAVVDAQIKLLRKRGVTVKTYFRSSEEIPRMKFGQFRAFFSGFYNHKSISEILKIIIDYKPDLVHVHNLYPLISPAVLKQIKAMNVPIVMTVHNYRLSCPNGLYFSKNEICERCNGGKEWNCIIRNCESNYVKSTGYALRNFYARIKKHYLNNVDRYLCLTEFQKGKMIENGYPRNRITIIPNMYKEDIPHQVHNVKKEYFASVGRISPEKGIEKLIYVARKLKHIEFKVAGQKRDGYLEDIKLPSNLEFVGPLSRTQLNEFYAKSIALIHTSRVYEGFPMVFPEAMSFRLPIIAPRMAGYPEIIKDELNGLLYDPDNTDDLISKINRLRKNPSQRLKYGEYGFKEMRSKYSELIYGNKLLLEYDEILK